MRLADFIRDNSDAILVEWEAFACTLPAASAMTSKELRDHAPEILDAITKDLYSEQSQLAQSEKSKGRAPVDPNAADTAAESHAVLRVRDGFDINALVAEYRALRASVLRLWDRANVGERGERSSDEIRFNEAIDQALTESVAFYSAQVDRSRTLLLAMVGHDLRSPLNSIQLGAAYLASLNVGADVAKVTQRLINGSSRIGALLDDLVDFNRSRLGLGIKVSPAP